MIRKLDDFFILDSGNTTYCLRINGAGLPEHLYYGKKITVNAASDAAALLEKRVAAPANTCLYDSGHREFSPEDLPLEASAYGHGDIREPFVEIVHADGGFSSDFVYDSFAISRESPEAETLPCSYGNAERLRLTLTDRLYGVTLELNYFVYDDCGVITRNARLFNNSARRVTLRRLMSAQLDFDGADYVLTSFSGAWAREMRRTDTLLSAGKHVNASYTGTSSSRANPFVMLSRRETSEKYGPCWGFNLIYSGNHYECAEVSSFGRTRFCAGINPQSFSFVLEAGESFEAPEAVMSFSGCGFGGLSRNLHSFVRTHIVRGEWRDRPRPVLLNSWEACYFDIDERRLLKLAEAAKAAGIELFVVDDGWFDGRNDDTRSLGDWTADRKKLPGGLDGLCRKVRALDLEFGLWVEPEMVSVNSRLYREHPDWAVQIPGQPHSEGRNQRILDLSRREVRDFVIESMSRVFSSAEISYVKWDMNRIFTDYYSASLPPDRQGETAHRYVTGLYECMRTLTARFPKILFEGCASGGNRFDLGILCYFPQIWASDNTDAICRAEIQNGYSFGYPMSALGAHVSACPNHQTLRTVPPETRFHTACFGIFGYECNLCAMSGEERAEVSAQVALYKRWRDVLQTGDFYRGRQSGNLIEWTCVSRDRRRAVGFLMQKLVSANPAGEYYRADGLAPELKYHFYDSRRRFGIGQRGQIGQSGEEAADEAAGTREAAGFRADGKTEECLAYGDTLMNAGVRLCQADGGGDGSGGRGLSQDFGSRLFFMEAETPE